MVKRLTATQPFAKFLFFSPAAGNKKPPPPLLPPPPLSVRALPPSPRKLSPRYAPSGTENARTLRDGHTSHHMAPRRACGQPVAGPSGRGAVRPLAVRGCDPRPRRRGWSRRSPWGGRSVRTGRCEAQAQETSASAEESGSKEAGAGDAAAASPFVFEDVLAAIRENGRDGFDYYDLLGVPLDAGPKAIKTAYRRRAKACHPDLAGDEGHEVCIVLNEAYSTLMDDGLREAYDVERQKETEIVDVDNPFAEILRDVPYTGEPLSDWCDPTQDGCCIDKEDQLAKGVFVDEITCIGCRACVWAAEGTFGIEEKHGRARVKAQWRNSEDDIQEAIDCCPVSCIHWVDRQQLAPLEYVMRHFLRDRVDVGAMLAGQGGHRLADVFTTTRAFAKMLDVRDERIAEILRSRRIRQEMLKRKEMEREEFRSFKSRLYDADLWQWMVYGFDNAFAKGKRGAEEAKVARRDE